MSVVASRTSRSDETGKEGIQEVQRLIEVLEEYFVYTSTGGRVVDINIAAGIALAELRRIKGFYEEEGLLGQETGSSPSPELKAL